MGCCQTCPVGPASARGEAPIPDPLGDHKGRSSPRKALVLLWMLLFLASGACLPVALRLQPSLIKGFTDVFLEECDVSLARESLPSDLKLLEGLIKSAPREKALLEGLCEGFAGYAMLFVEEDEPQRASSLYLRALRYGRQAMGWPAPRAIGLAYDPEELDHLLQGLSEEDLPLLFWSSVAWAGWIRLNLDDPRALDQWPGLQRACQELLRRCPTYLHGGPYILMGTLLAARPSMAGGDPGKAKTLFEKAMDLNHGDFFLTQYAYARYYAVRVQDKPLFLRLVQDVTQRHASALPDVCLLNQVMKARCEALAGRVSDYFLD